MFDVFRNHVRIAYLPQNYKTVRRSVTALFFPLGQAQAPQSGSGHGSLLPRHGTAEEIKIRIESLKVG